MSQDDRFFLVSTFKLAVPQNYNHAAQLASFGKENRDRFSHYDEAITDTNFAGVTQKLVPGKTYLAKIFGISRTVSPQDCLTFLETRKALLVGAQGLSLAWQLKKGEFPRGKRLISFDKKDALWKDLLDRHGVPHMRQSTRGDWEFSLFYFEDFWFSDDRLLCLCDLDESA